MLFSDYHINDFDSIVPNAINYVIFIEAYAKNEDLIFNLVDKAYNTKLVLLDFFSVWEYRLCHVSGCVGLW